MLLTSPVHTCCLVTTWVLHQDLIDDGECGAGRAILKKMRENQAMNQAIYVVRDYGGVHLGPRRFEIITGCHQKCNEQAIDEDLKQALAVQAASKGPN